MAQYIYSMHRVGKIVPPKKYILKNISLSFFPGAKIGVLGLNGSGKSTLLRIMAGLDTEIEGEANPLKGTNIGYLSQEPQLDLTKTVRGNVEEAVVEVKAALAQLDQVYLDYAEPDADFDKLAAEQARLEDVINACDGHNLERKLEVAADALRLPDWDANVATLSGGEKRRVALCRLLLSNPDMLLLDEPTAVLDIGQQEKLMHIVRSLVEEGRTVIAVFHDLNVAMSFADRVILLQNGRHAASGTPRETLTPETLSSIYEHKIDVIRVNDDTGPVVIPGPRKN